MTVIIWTETTVGMYLFVSNCSVSLFDYPLD